MNTSVRISVSILTLCAVAAGCRSNGQPAPADTQPSPLVRHDSARPGIQSPVASRPPQQAPQPDPPTPGTAQALAQRAASYAESIEPLVARRGARPKTGEGNWPDPDALHLTSQPSETVVTENSSAPAPLPNTGLAAPQKPLAASIHEKRGAPVGEAAQAGAEGTFMPGAPPVTTSSDTLAKKFTQHVRDYPADVAGQVEDELLKFLRDESVPDVQAMAALSAEDRELLSALMDSLTNLRNQLRSDNNMLFSRKIRPLIELSDRLRGQAELSLPTIALCTRVKAFGVYEPIDPARFTAGREQSVVVYCEVENFLSQLNGKKLYETRLTEDIVLYTESSGLEVWRDKKSTYIDLARTHRHDFFIGKVITLPANLTIGGYLMKVTVEDQQARHVAENTVPVEIVAQ